MCGICGFISKQKITYDTLRGMNDSMYHRGPDDSGEEIKEIKDGYNLGMAQRRLAIMDLSKLGHQPMHSEDGSIDLIFNGEIYNFLDIKKEIYDYKFKSTCDTEVIIAAYLKWGIDCVNKFNGMFAIALYDHRQETLYLVRDRIGKKPLYYYTNGQEIVFASTLKPIEMFPGFAKDINLEVIGSFLEHQYIVSPNSIYKNVYKVCPGEIIIYRKGRLEQYKYWDIIKKYNSCSTFEGTYNEAKIELKRLLTDSIQKRMVADVPVGVFLSGGYDSTLVSCLAQEISDGPIKTFCIGINDNNYYNEAKYANEISKIIGTDYTELYINENELYKLIDNIPKYYDEPFADVSQIPTMLVAELAKTRVTVVLSGDGGDELFCGYNHYDMINRLQKYNKLGKIINYLGYSTIGERLHVMEHVHAFTRVLAKNSVNHNKLQYRVNFSKNVIDNMVIKNGKIYYRESDIIQKNWQEARMLLDQCTYLPDDIMCKVDRASMAYSLEARSPLLDYRIVEFAQTLPHEFKYKKGNKKRILKDLVYDYIPYDLMDRPKQGFGIPIEKWLKQGRIKDMLIDYANKSYLKDQGIFDEVYTNELINRYLSNERDKNVNLTSIIWAFVIFQQWFGETGL